MDDIEKTLENEYYEESTLLCIPVSISPDEIFQFIKIQILDGIHIRKIADGEREHIQANYKNHYLQHRTHLTHLICIDRPEYLSALKKRLIGLGYDLPGFIQIEYHSIVKHAVLSIFLAAPMVFKVDAGGGVKIKYVKGKKEYLGSSYVKGWLYEVPDEYWYFIVSSGLRDIVLNPNDVRELAAFLDPYFRAGIWWQNRMAAALAHLIDALCCKSIVLTYLSLTSTLEALVNSSKNEMTHQICERIAVLCGDSHQERLDIYYLVKKLYGTRSTLVHGQAHNMKGEMTWDSLLVSPKFSVVPIEDVKALFRITVMVIRAILKDKELISIYESSRDEGKVNKKITNYFVRKLL